MEDLVVWYNALDSVHKDICNYYSKFPNKSIQRFCEDIACIRDEIAKKIELASK